MNGMIFYRCDCRACPEGCDTHSGGDCDLTTDPEHARNFEMVDGVLVEKPDGRNLHLDDRGPYKEGEHAGVSKLRAADRGDPV